MVLGNYLVASFLLLLASFLILRISFRYDYFKRGRLSPFTILAGTLIFFIWGGFPYIFGPKDWPAVHVSPLQRILGLGALFAGLALMFSSMTLLGIWRSMGQNQSALVERGFYRLSRNPQVVGCDLYGIGFAILWPSWYALGWVLMLPVMTHMMVLTEEEHLRNAYGDKYISYCQRVPRYLGIPFSGIASEKENWKSSNREV